LNRMHTGLDELCIGCLAAQVGIRSSRNSWGFEVVDLVADASLDERGMSSIPWEVSSGGS
jgi:hypothetical protein